MERDTELRTKFSKVLGRYDLQSNLSWEEIFAEVGKLIERAEQRNPYLATTQNPNLLGTSGNHFHNGAGCLNVDCAARVS